MKKNLVIITILALSVIISACNNNTPETFESPFIGGDIGLEIEFEQMGSTSDTSGVNEVWEDEPFLIETIIKNKGEHDIAASDIKVDLKGFAQNDFEGIQSMSQSNVNPIEKISEFLPDGEEDRLSFGNAKYVINFDGFYDAIIQAEARYKYKTFVAVPQVCFKEDLRDDTVCRVDEAKTFYSSAAPIQATTVTEKPGGKGTVFLEIDIRNTGGFTAIGRSTTPGGELKIEYDTIAYQSIGPNSNPNLWVCTSGGKVNEARLVNGVAKIRCKANIPPDANYVQQFSLELEYDYVENIRENVRIKEALE